MTAMTRLQILRGTTAQRISFVPKKGELVMDLDSNFLYIGDGVTAGGVLAAPLAAVTDRIAVPVKNLTGAPILKGSPLNVLGSSGGMILVEPADAATLAKAYVTLVADSLISHNSTGLGVIAGVVTNIDLTGFTAGSPAFLAAGGGYSPTMPAAPNFITIVGEVVQSGASGILLVQISNPLGIPNLPTDHVSLGIAGDIPTTINLYEAVRNTVLTGLSLLVGGAISAADTVLGALGKLQKQVSDNLTTLNTHIANLSNPHAVTKAQVGLSNVPNVDATLRSNHTGSQLASTISDFDTAADARITAQKAQPNGLATLGGDGKLPTSQLPALAITDSFVVGSQAAMLALIAETGDIAIRTDLNKSFILSGDPTILANWQELLSPTDSVLSVNGQTGVVVLTTTHITEGTNLYFTTARVLATLLAGLDTGLTGAITAGDTVLTAMGRLQNQITARALASTTITAGTGLTGGGDLSANRTISLANTAVTAGTYGLAGSIAQFIVDAQGRLTSAVNVAISITASQVSDFASSVRGTVLTGLTFPVDTAIAATDTILEAFGKLQGQINVWNELVTTADLTSSSNTVTTAVPELGFAVTNGKKYYIEYAILFRAAGLNTGFAFTANTPDTAAGTIALTVDIPTSADGANNVHSGAVTSLGDLVISSSVETINTDYICSVQGVFICTASGILQPHFRSEVNGSQVTLRLASVGLIREF